MSAARVLVTGVGGPAGRSLYTQLGQRGIDVIAADMAAIELPSAHRIPPATEPSFAAKLAALAHWERADLVVPTVTEELDVLAQPGQWAGPPIVLAPWTAVRLAADKYLTCIELERAGIAVPRFALPSTLGKRWLGTRYLSKPRISRGSRGIAIHNGYDKCGLDDRWVLQEYLPGREYAPNVYLHADPQRDVVIVLEKTACSHGDYGNATSVIRKHNAAVASLARASARALGLRGPADIDIRYNADGVPAVLEINARFGANSAHAPEIVDALLDEWLPQLRSEVA
ncbi:MAG TPA: ATP-grasp domain-containing protein [Pseudonocardiaceae bacterium]|nr:ATP-grasp domain-containing protein [Pseudonocardiaceae bacterium]